MSPIWITGWGHWGEEEGGGVGGRRRQNSTSKYRGRGSSKHDYRIVEKIGEVIEKTSKREEGEGHYILFSLLLGVTQEELICLSCSGDAWNLNNLGSR